MTEFEPWSFYQQRKAYLDQKAAAQKATQAAAAQAARTETPGYVAARQAERDQEKQRNPFVDVALNALGTLERPGAAVRTALTGDLGAAARQLDPTSPVTAPSGFDLSGGGFGLSRENIGPLPFSPADVAGRAVEAATDPLTYIPFGSPLKVAKALPAAARRIVATPTPVDEMDEMAGLIKLISPAEMRARNTTETWGRKIPGGQKLSTLFSSRARDTEDDLGSFLRAVDGAQDTVRGWVDANMAPFRSFKVAEGPNVIGDVVEGLKPAASLSVEGQTAARIAQRKIASAEELLDDSKAALAAVAPDLADSPAFTFPRVAGYFPRAMVKEKDGTLEYALIGGRRGIQMGRNFATRAEGEAAGFKYLSDTEALGHYLNAVGSKVTDMRMLTELAKSPWARAVGRGEKAVNASEIEAARKQLGEVERLQELASRAFRGERLMPAQLDPFAATFPKEVTDIRRVIAGGNAPDLTGHLDAVFQGVRGQLDTYVGQRDKAVWDLKLRTKGLAEIPGTTYHSLWLDAGDAAQMGKHLAREDVFNKATGFWESLAHAAKAIAPIRGLVAAGDLSFAFLQNLPVLARNPEVGLTNIGLGVRAVLNPEFRQKWLAQPDVQDTLSRFPGLTVGGAELGATRKTISEIPLIGWGAARVPGVVGALEGSQRGWDLMGEASRVLMAQGMKNAPAGTEGQVVDFLNHATGVLSSRALGIGPKQRAAEDMALFAPRYLRASLALVGDLLGGSVTRPEALKTLASMAVAGAWWYQRVADMNDEKPIWDVSDGRFMTIDVAGNRLGVGGTYRSLMNLIGKVGTHPETVIQNPLDPENQNPLVRFWRGRASIPLQRAWDIVYHETFNGTPIDDNFGDLAKWAGTSILPFAIAGLIQEQGTGEQKAAGFAADIVGLRAFPEGWTDVTDRVAQRDFGKRFGDLDEIQKAQVQQSPEVKGLPASAGVRGERGREVQKYQDQWKAAIEKSAGQVQAGTITAADFRERVNKANLEREIQLETVPERRQPQDLDSFQQAREQYLSYLRKEDEFGRKGYDAAAAFLETLSKDQQAYIEDRQLASLEALGPEAKRLMQELKAARTTLKPYWEIARRRLEAVGLWDQYVNASPAEQDRLEDSRKFKVADTMAKRDKERMRLRSPEIDAALVRWHSLVPIRGRRR